jgi:hypothetical protein
MPLCDTIDKGEPERTDSYYRITVTAIVPMARSCNLPPVGPPPLGNISAVLGWAEPRATFSRLPLVMTRHRECLLPQVMTRHKKSLILTAAFGLAYLAALLVSHCLTAPSPEGKTPHDLGGWGLNLIATVVKLANRLMRF